MSKGALWRLLALVLLGVGLLAVSLAPALVSANVDTCEPPSGLSLSHTPAQVYAGMQVSMTGQVVTGSLPLTYTWTWGDGTAPLTGTWPTWLLSATHAYTLPQLYTATLAVDNACSLTPTAHSLAIDVQPCGVLSGTAMAYQPAEPRAGQTVTLTALLTGSGPALDPRWAFGDGGTASGVVVSHVYSAPATYTLALTVPSLCSPQVVTATARLTVAPPLRVFLPLVSRGAGQAIPNSGLGYGASIAASDHAVYLGEMGFDWAMGFVRWSDVGAGPNYNWAAVDNQLRDFVPHAGHVLLRVHHPTPPGIADPPVSAGDLSSFQAFCQALAAHVDATWRPQGLETVAYEVWNEPNLGTEWGTPPVQPSAAQYTALLKVGYQGLKAGDPRAVVVSAGLATTGGSLADSPAERAAALAWARSFYRTDLVVPDLTFLRNMYNNGARGFFDALGSHPYGGRDAPGTPPDLASGPIYFRRAEEQRAVMVSYGDQSPVWATEFGWIVETSCDLGQFNWMKVSEAQQAAYLAAAYAYAGEHWPWIGPLFFFNLDFGTVYYYATCDPMRYFSITYRQNPDSTEPILTRPAFDSLQAMPKESDW